jgi:hypothetical protein
MSETQGFTALHSNTKVHCFLNCWLFVLLCFLLLFSGSINLLICWIKCHSVNLMFIWSCIASKVFPTRYRTRLAGEPLLRVATIRRTTDTFPFVSHTTNVPLFKFRCNIFIGVRIIKEVPGSVASGTSCIIINDVKQDANIFYLFISSLLYMFRATFSPIIRST